MSIIVKLNAYKGKGSGPQRWEIPSPLMYQIYFSCMFSLVRKTTVSSDTELLAIMLTLKGYSCTKLFINTAYFFLTYNSLPPHVTAWLLNNWDHLKGNNESYWIQVTGKSLVWWLWSAARAMEITNVCTVIDKWPSFPEMTHRPAWRSDNRRSEMLIKHVPTPECDICLSCWCFMLGELDMFT